MDRRPQQLLMNSDRQYKRILEPRSRIADYISGALKLEDLVGRDKIVKPQDRHNKRVVTNVNSINPPYQYQIPRSKRFDVNSTSISRSLAPSVDQTLATNSVYSEHSSRVDITSSYRTSGSIVDGAYHSHLVSEKDKQIDALKKQVISLSDQVNSLQISGDELLHTSKKLEEELDHLRTEKQLNLKQIHDLENKILSIENGQKLQFQREEKLRSNLQEMTMKNVKLHSQLQTYHRIFRSATTELNAWLEAHYKVEEELETKLNNMEITDSDLQERADGYLNVKTPVENGIENQSVHNEDEFKKLKLEFNFLLKEIQQQRKEMKVLELDEIDFEASYSELASKYEILEKKHKKLQYERNEFEKDFKNLEILALAPDGEGLEKYETVKSNIINEETQYTKQLWESFEKNVPFNTCLKLNGPSN